MDGAIVAGELAIPCVIGARNGTAAVRTGDRLRVDGSLGSVEIVRRAAAARAADVGEPTLD